MGRWSRGCWPFCPGGEGARGGRGAPGGRPGRTRRRRGGSTRGAAAGRATPRRGVGAGSRRRSRGPPLGPQRASVGPRPHRHPARHLGGGAGVIRGGPRAGPGRLAAPAWRWWAWGLRFSERGRWGGRPTELGVRWSEGAVRLEEGLAVGDLRPGFARCGVAGRWTRGGARRTAPSPPPPPPPPRVTPRSKRPRPDGPPTAAGAARPTRAVGVRRSTPRHRRSPVHLNVWVAVWAAATEARCGPSGADACTDRPRRRRSVLSSPAKASAPRRPAPTVAASSPGRPPEHRSRLDERASPRPDEKTAGCWTPAPAPSDLARRPRRNGTRAPRATASRPPSPAAPASAGPAPPAAAVRPRR